MTTGQAQPVMRGTNPLDVADTTANVATNQALDAALAANIDGKDSYPQSVTTQRINISEGLTIGDDVLLTDGCIDTEHLASNSVTASKIFASGLTSSDISFSGTLSGFGIANLGTITAGSISVGTGGVTIGTSGSGIYIGANTITAVVGGVVKFSLNGTTGAAYFAGEITASKFSCTADPTGSIDFGKTITVNGDIKMSTSETTRYIYLSADLRRFIYSTQYVVGVACSNAVGSEQASAYLYSGRSTAKMPRILCDVPLSGISSIQITNAGTTTTGFSIIAGCGTDSASYLRLQRGSTVVMSYLGNSSDVSFSGNIRVASAQSITFEAGTVDPQILAGTGVPAAGLGAIGSIYMSAGGSLYFKQAAGWKRIDNWIS